MLPDKKCPFDCIKCAAGVGLNFEFTMAFQPIVNVTTRTIYAQEALVRGLNNESATQIFQHVTDDNRYQFDQACRVKAVRLAAQLGIQSLLSINFMPNAVFRPEFCIRSTLEAAKLYAFSLDRIIFEVAESEQVDDLPYLREILQYYQQIGFKTAVDDFGAGYSDLERLVALKPDLVKLDRLLIEQVERAPKQQAIIKNVIRVARELSAQVVAEGVETPAQLIQLRALGIDLFQGFYFAKPAFQAIARVPPEIFLR